MGFFCFCFLNFISLPPRSPTAIFTSQALKLQPHSATLARRGCLQYAVWKLIPQVAPLDGVLAYNHWVLDNDLLGSADSLGFFLVIGCFGNGYFGTCESSGCTKSWGFKQLHKTIENVFLMWRMLCFLRTPVWRVTACSPISAHLAATFLGLLLWGTGGGYDLRLHQTRCAATCFQMYQTCSENVCAITRYSTLSERTRHVWIHVSLSGVCYFIEGHLWCKLKWMFMKLWTCFNL